ncbi:FAD:protein FMN transferase [Adlercreutzia shanghongiae]|uniref:FAD:protein FMN transferase n=1 Tax=Adlercreutzia shanghongiae TaxID=3111773 RepID=A0ABU6IYM3_9ACTN|nr:FAD:protein FMN transferase [Adlercreutzia sp. R22]MEC4294949.1 FAD:protein FMN transferase [Adlercreutzia sp. R22]
MHPAADGKPAGVRFLAFNTVIDIEAYGDKATCTAAFEEARSLCRLYERLLSRTLPHSDIARINNAQGAATEIDPLTYDLLSKALVYCAESEGVFDITVGPAVRLWNFHEGVVPDADELAEAVRHVDWRGLKLWEAEGGRFAQLADPQAAVDAGGIAKGWIADALVAAMEARGLAGIIVNLGGNVAVSGAKPTGEPWRVGIRDPREPSQLIGAVPLAGGSAVTSGVYERCFTAPDGTFYHHILGPHTGMPVETDVAGVTVICEKSIDAEGFSTTLLALGLKRGLALACRRPEISQAFFIDAAGTITAAR